MEPSQKLERNNRSISVIFLIANIFLSYWYISDTIRYFQNTYYYDGIRYFIPIFIFDILCLTILITVVVRKAYSPLLVGLLLIAIIHNLIVGTGQGYVPFIGLILVLSSIILTVLNWKNSDKKKKHQS